MKKKIGLSLYLLRKTELVFLKRFADKINFVVLEFIFLILNFLISFKMFFKGKLSELRFTRINFSPSNPSKVNQWSFVELKHE